MTVLRKRISNNLTLCCEELESEISGAKKKRRSEGKINETETRKTIKPTILRTSF